ncbi:MAG: tetratricopeptide repeat protein [Lachnospiraceae bacterium]|nr:tetratricopeptide repeat protein [Lachnospiraceae bacterium]
MKNKKIFGVIALAVVIIAVSAGMILYNNSAGVQLKRQLDLGNKYLEELNYEEAIAAFNLAIEIDSRSVEAYLGLADAYLGMGDKVAALEALQTGYDLTGDEELLAKRDEVQAQLERIRLEEQRRLEGEQAEKEKEQKKAEMEKNTPDAVKQLYAMMSSADDEEIARFVVENGIGVFEGAYTPSGDMENGIILEMFGQIDWAEFGYTGWRNSYNLYYGEKVNGSYETQGKWYVIWGMAEYVEDKVEYWVYDGEWKNGRPNGTGKIIQIQENYGTHSYNGVVTQEGYAIQKWEIISSFYDGYVCGDYQKYYEWDIYNSLSWFAKDIREYKGTANQKSEVIGSEYVKDLSTGEWKALDDNINRGAGYVYGFCGLCENTTWHDRLINE